MFENSIKKALLEKALEADFAKNIEKLFSAIESNVSEDILQLVKGDSYGDPR